MTDQPKHREISKEEEQKYRALIGAYGDVIDKTEDLRGDVFDISWLPASKGEIKKALLWKCQNSPELIDPITIAYAALRKFQPDVGEYVPELMPQVDRKFRDNFGLDKDIDLVSSIKGDENSEKMKFFAEKLMELARQHQSLMEKWKPIIESEWKQLDQELIDLGYLPEDFEEQVKKLAEVRLKEIKEKRREEVFPNTPEAEPQPSQKKQGSFWRMVLVVVVFVGLLRIIYKLFFNP